MQRAITSDSLHLRKNKNPNHRELFEVTRYSQQINQYSISYNSTRPSDHFLLGICNSVFPFGQDTMRYQR